MGWSFKDRRKQEVEEEAEAATEATETSESATDGPQRTEAQEGLELEKAEHLADAQFRKIQQQAAELAKTAHGQKLFSLMVFSRRLYSLSYGQMQNLMMAQKVEEGVDQLITVAAKSDADEQFTIDVMLYDACKLLTPWLVDLLETVNKAQREGAQALQQVSDKSKQHKKGKRK